MATENELETVFYSLPFGDASPAISRGLSVLGAEGRALTTDAEQQLILLEHDGAGFMPVFRSRESLHAFFTQHNCAAYWCPQGTLETVADALAQLGSPPEQTTNTGFVIEPLSEHPVFLPAAPGLEAPGSSHERERVKAKSVELQQGINRIARQLGVQPKRVGLPIMNEGFHVYVGKDGACHYDYWERARLKIPRSGSLDDALFWYFENQGGSKALYWELDLQRKISWIDMQLQQPSLRVGLGICEGLNIYVDVRGGYHYAHWEGGKQTYDRVGTLDDVLFWYASTSSEPVYALFQKLSQLNPEWGKRLLRERAH